MCLSQFTLWKESRVWETAEAKQATLLPWQPQACRQVAPIRKDSELFKNQKDAEQLATFHVKRIKSRSITGFQKQFVFAKFFYVLLENMDISQIIMMCHRWFSNI